MAMRDDAGIFEGRARGRTHGYRPYFAEAVPCYCVFFFAIFAVLLTE